MRWLKKLVRKNNYDSVSNRDNVNPLSLVKRGDIIKINYSEHIEQYITICWVANNNSTERKIHLCKDYDKEKHQHQADEVLSYSDKRLRNFTTLNVVTQRSEGGSLSISLMNNLADAVLENNIPLAQVIAQKIKKMHGQKQK